VSSDAPYSALQKNNIGNLGSSVHIVYYNNLVSSIEGTIVYIGCWCSLSTPIGNFILGG